jgi:hypothetical protein
MPLPNCLLIAWMKRIISKIIFNKTHCQLIAITSTTILLPTFLTKQETMFEITLTILKSFYSHLYNRRRDKEKSYFVNWNGKETVVLAKLADASPKLSIDCLNEN